MGNVQETLRDMIRRSGRSLKEIAEALGVHPVTMRAFQCGTLELKLENLEKLAEMFGAEIAVIHRSPEPRFLPAEEKAALVTAGSAEDRMRKRLADAETEE